jgi:hypothetical protein
MVRDTDPTKIPTRPFVIRKPGIATSVIQNAAIFIRREIGAKIQVMLKRSSTRWVKMLTAPNTKAETIAVTGLSISMKGKTRDSR